MHLQWRSHPAFRSGQWKLLPCKVGRTLVHKATNALHICTGLACMDHLCMQLVRALATTTVPAALSLGDGHTLACELVPTVLPLRATHGHVTPSPALMPLRAVLRVQVRVVAPRASMVAPACMPTDGSAV